MTTQTATARPDHFPRAFPGKFWRAYHEHSDRRANDTYTVLSRDKDATGDAAYYLTHRWVDEDGDVYDLAPVQIPVWVVTLMDGSPREVPFGDVPRDLDAIGWF